MYFRTILYWRNFFQDLILPDRCQAMGRFLFHFLVFLGILKTGFSLFREEHVITTKGSEPPYLLRILYHVYYIGVHDNGTLSCRIPGAVSYHWNGISKEEVTEGGYVYSWADQMKIPNRERPWEMEIHQRNFLTDSLLVQCQGESGYGGNLIVEILWVITRLHSPLGYPTDPMICGGRNNKCERFHHLFRIHCDPGYGGQYHGTISRSLSGSKCADWNMLHHKVYRPWYRYEIYNKYYRHTYWGEHNYCRTSVKNGLRLGPQCYLRLRGGTVQLENCDVPRCSDCKYGRGNGKLIGYRFSVPQYTGLAVNTLKSYKSGKKTQYRTCYRRGADFWHHENLCRNSLKVRGKKYVSGVPSCLVYKGDGTIEEVVPKWKINEKLQLAKCRIRQCTIRIVWFLFLDEKGHLIIDIMSSEKPRKFTSIRGLNLKITYIVFGVNLLSGLNVGSKDEGKKKIASRWKNVVKRAPEMSVLHVGKTTTTFSGIYYFHYVFEEADRSVELGVYRQMFEIEILDPLTITLSPIHMKLCEWEKGVIQLKMAGDFKITAENIEWRYAFYGDPSSHPVTLVTNFIKISDDTMKVTVSMPVQIYVIVKWKHGTLKAKATVTNIEKPVLQNISPFLTIAVPGKNVKLTLATNSAENKLKWIHDAQQISEVPEDPNMAFSQIHTAKEVVHSLNIENIQDHHYGVYIVRASNSQKCQCSLELILKKFQTSRSFENDIDPTLAPLTNGSVAQFKVVMDFMNKECSDLIGRPHVLPTDSSNEDSDLSSESDDYENSTLEDDESRRTKRSAPMAARERMSLAEPLCIYLQLPDSYFEINLESFTRVKGIRLLHPPAGEDTEERSSTTYRFMYSINDCKWKIYGIKSYKDVANISVQANNTGLVKSIQMKYETETFTVDGNTSWIGNKSIILAKHVRLLPTAIDSRNKTCIEVHIYGCSATILEIPKEPTDSSEESGSGSIVFVLAIFALVAVIVSVVVGVLFAKGFFAKGFFSKRWKTKKKRTVLSESSESDETKEEHIYWEIPYTE